MKRPSFPILVLLISLAVAVLTWRIVGQPFVRIDAISRSVVAPQVVTVTTAAQYVFTSNPSHDAGRVVSRYMQNTGTVPVIYAIGSVASTTSYHGILAAGTVVRDGLGSGVDLSRYPGQVSVVTASGSSTVCLVELQQ